MASSQANLTDRKNLIYIAALFVVVILGGSLTFGFVSNQDAKTSTTTTLVGSSDDTNTQGQARPRSIPRPGEGEKPTDPGKPGGWEQLLLFGVVLSGMAAIAAIVIRGNKKARANRAAWRAAVRRVCGSI